MKEKKPEITREDHDREMLIDEQAYRELNRRLDGEEQQIDK